MPPCIASRSRPGPRAAALAALLLALLAPRPGAAQQLLDGIAAQVGGDIVLVSEVMQMIAPMEAELRRNGAPALEIARLRAEGLERMIEWRLIEQVVRRTELYASDAEVDAAIDSIAEENGLLREDLEKSVTSHGLTLEDYRGQIKREIERSKVLGAIVGPKVRVEEDAIRRLYDERYGDQPAGGDQVHLRQLLVPSGGEAGPSLEQACAQVRQAHARVQAGEPFERVAAGAGNAVPGGGDIGWLHASELSGWMLGIVRSLEPGQVSDVIQQPFGCALLQVVDRREYARVTYEIARPALEREIGSTLEAQEYREWLEKLREQTYIERRGYFAEAAQMVAPGPGTAQRE